MFSESYCVVVCFVWVEYDVAGAPPLDARSVGAEAFSDDVRPGALLELVEEGFGWEAVFADAFGHQSRLNASLSYTSSPHSSRKNCSVVC